MTNATVPSFTGLGTRTRAEPASSRGGRPAEEPDGADEAARERAVAMSFPRKQQPHRPIPRETITSTKTSRCVPSPGSRQPAVTTDNCRQVEIFLGQEKGRGG